MKQKPIVPVALLAILFGATAVGFFVLGCSRGADRSPQASYEGAVASISQGLLPGKARFVGEIPGWSRYTYSYSWRGVRGCTIDVEQKIESIDQNREKAFDVHTSSVFTLDLSRQDPNRLASNAGENPPFVAFDEDVVVRSQEYTRTGQGTQGAAREGRRYLVIYAADAAAARSLADAFADFTRTCRDRPPMSSGNEEVPAEPPAASDNANPEDSTRVAVQPPPPSSVPAPQPVFDLRAVIDDPDGYTNVRSTQSTSGAILARVVDGEVFETYRQEGNWWRVRTASGIIGYMHVSRIRLVN